MATATDAGLMRQGPSRRWILGHLLCTGLIRPRALLALASALCGTGANLVALARFGAAATSPCPRLIDDTESVTFGDLATQAERLAALLRHEHAAGKAQAIGILGDNSAGLVRSLLAVSRLGARAILLNPHLPAAQIEQLVQRHRIAIVLAPDGTEKLVARDRLVVCDPADLLRGDAHGSPRLPWSAAGEIVVLTGGTTGLPKAARRAVAPVAVLRLFLHLIAALQLERRRSVYVAVPLFHGFGLSALLIAMALGRTVHVRRRFDAASVAELAEGHGIDTIAVVPTMLRRLLPAAKGAKALKCIVSGGAPLPASLVEEARRRFGDILFNLYGTSEAGLSALATPEDLAIAPDTIGRAVWGAEVAIRSVEGKLVSADQVGALYVRNRASIAARAWIATGDRASRDRDGRLFLHGRADDMIVSGGENVSPWDVESVLLTHPHVADAAAVGVPDSDYGQRLIVVVAPAESSTLDANALLTWLVPRVARHQMPRHIAIRPTLPLTTIGKVDRQMLTREFS